MKMIVLTLLCCCCCCCFTCVLVRAQEPATQPAVVNATDTDAITEAKGKDSVTVEGVISRAEWSRSGKVMNIEFKDSPLIAAVFDRERKKMDDAFNGDLGKSLTGAKVRIKGKIADYRGKPQVIINSADQITIVEPSATTQPGQ